MPFPQASKIAERWASLIHPFCHQVMVVGSVRRHASEVGDIELLVIPVPVIKYDMFGEGMPDKNLTNNLLEHNLGKYMQEYNWGAQFEKNGPKYKKLNLREGISLDIFLSTRESWPVELAIRTGPAEFSHRCVMPRKIGGWLPSDCRIHDGWRVWRGTKEVPMVSERAFLEFLGLGWIEPWDRHERLVAGESKLP